MPQDVPMGDGTFVGPTPDYLTAEAQALLRFPSTVHRDQMGFSQTFRGVVGTNASLVLSATGPYSWTPELFGAAGRSTMMITTSRDRTGTGVVVSQDERGARTNPDRSRVGRVYDNAMRLNRIQGIVRQPIDQILQMEIGFGEYYGSNMWTGSYASGGTYQLESSGTAISAQIRLTCSNPLNPGFFNFGVSVRNFAPVVAPAPAPAAQPAPPAGPSFTQQLGEEFRSGIRSIENGSFRF